MTATKQLSKLQIITTFTRSWDHIAGTWQPNDPAGILGLSDWQNDPRREAREGELASRRSARARTRRQGAARLGDPPFTEGSNPPGRVGLASDPTGAARPHVGMGPARRGPALDLKTQILGRNAR